MPGENVGETEKKGQATSVGSKLPLDRKHLNVLWNHINKPSYQRERPNSQRKCHILKKDFFSALYEPNYFYERKVSKNRWQTLYVL